MYPSPDLVQAFIDDAHRRAVGHRISRQVRDRQHARRAWRRRRRRRLLEALLRRPTRQPAPPSHA